MNDEVLYLEADEEITAAIDKMLKVKSPSIKIVVPKRSSLLQSIVNLKLLKKAAEDAGKQLVLVTADRTATHLAGRVGLPVAASLQSQAATPVIEPQTEMASEVVEAEEEPVELPVRQGGVPISPVSPTPSKPVGTPKPSYAKPMMVHKPIDSEPAAAADIGHKQSKVPDFNKLQKRLLLMFGGVVLIIGLLVANYFMTGAHVVLYAKGTIIKADFTFAVDPSAAKTDLAAGILTGEKVQSTHNLTASTPATGQKDVGTKAHGTMVVKNEYDTNAHPLVAGTRFQSSGGKVFRSENDVTVPGATPTLQNGQLGLSPGSVSVAVTAETAGDSYNLAPSRYTIPALPADQQAKIYGDANQMSGGTTKTVAVITQADITKARDEALAKDHDGAKKDLENKAKANQRPIAESFLATVDSVTSNPGLDNEGSAATVTVRVSYTELAVDKTDYERLVKDREQKQVSDQNQIYDTGIDSATITVKDKETSSRQSFQYTADAYGGAKIDPSNIAQQLKGKKYGDAADIATKIPGVDKAEITLTPGWATGMPSIPSHIKIEIKIAPKS